MMIRTLIINDRLISCCWYRHNSYAYEPKN